jgi:hypothetical protein
MDLVHAFLNFIPYNDVPLQRVLLELIVPSHGHDVKYL